MTNLSAENKGMAYLSPSGSFSHEVALELQDNKNYVGTTLLPARSIAEVCEMVIDGYASYGVLPIENSTDGPVSDGLKSLKQHPLRIVGEYVHPISQSLYFRTDTQLRDIKVVASKDSALGQCRQTVDRLFQVGVTYEPRDSTVAAVLEAAKNPHLAGIGPRMAGEVNGLSDILTQIDNVHDDPRNTTRFFIIEIGNRETPVTGNDKTSFIAQVPDRPGSLYATLDTLLQQGINLAKIKSFGRVENEVAFFMSLTGHQQELPLDTALKQLAGIGVGIKMLGSYAASDYVSPQVTDEGGIDYKIAQLRADVTNSQVPNKTVVAFTLKDRVGALRDALEPFSRRGIDLIEIDSLPTGKLGEYIFYLSFVNGTHQSKEALDELQEQTNRLHII